MRKVTQLTAEAFINGQQLTIGNTKVLGNAKNALLTLHNNVIASREDDRLILTDSGWRTVTTKERLNGLLTVIGSEWRIYQMAGNWYIADGCGKRKDWDGTLEVQA